MSNFFDGGANGARVDVAALLDSRASDLLGVAVQGGALVSLGLTRDGGALGVTVTVDGRWNREYHRDADSLVDWLTAGMDDILAACGAATASAEPRKRQRSVRGR